jgi:hypothetical protein
MNDDHKKIELIPGDLEFKDSPMYDNDNDLVLYESIWSRKQTIFNPVVNEHRHL